MNMPVVLMMLVLLTTPLTCLADDYGTLNPAAPPQVKQFAFIVGHWDATLTVTLPDGTSRLAHVDWYGRFILNGTAIQETWLTTPADGSEPTWGTAINAWDAKKGEWVCAEYTTPETELLVMSGSLVGNDLVQSHDAVSRRDGAKILVKKYFYDIAPDRFKWRVEVSRDGGATWQPTGTVIEAKRIP